MAAPAAHFISPGLHLPVMPKEAAGFESMKSIATQKPKTQKHHLFFILTWLYVFFFSSFRVTMDSSCGSFFRHLLICVLSHLPHPAMEPPFCSVHGFLGNTLNVTIDARMKHAEHIVHSTIGTATLA